MATSDEVQLVVDPVSLNLLKGSAVDFVEDLGGATFKVTNPNAQSGCGCGSQLFRLNIVNPETRFRGPSSAGTGTLHRWMLKQVRA